MYIGDNILLVIDAISLTLIWRGLSYSIPQIIISSESPYRCDICAIPCSQPNR